MKSKTRDVRVDKDGFPIIEVGDYIKLTCGAVICVRKIIDPWNLGYSNYHTRYEGDGIVDEGGMLISSYGFYSGAYKYHLSVDGIVAMKLMGLVVE